MSRLDPVGLGLFGAAAVWALVAAAGRPSAPESFLGALAVAAGAYVVGRFLGTAVGSVRSAGALAFLIGAILLLSPGALSGTATAPPLDYGNANGALVAQGAGAACLAAMAAWDERHRRGWLALGAALVVATLLTRSAAAAICAAGVFVVGFCAPLVRRRGPVVLAGALCAAAAIVGTVILGVVQPDGETAEDLTDRRLKLWHEAVGMTKDNPVRGTGTGTFPAESPTARSDKDVHSTHSLWLRQSAEQGVVGGLLLVSVVGWGYARLWRSPQSPAVVAVGAAALSAFAVQASVDYTAEFPAVLGVTAVVLGLATAQDADIR
jgi:O-antigen ligase